MWTGCKIGYAYAINLCANQPLEILIPAQTSIIFRWYRNNNPYNNVNVIRLDKWQIWDIGYPILDISYLYKYKYL